MTEPTEDDDWEIPKLWRCPDCYTLFEERKDGQAICPKCGKKIVEGDTRSGCQ